MKEYEIETSRNISVEKAKRIDEIDKWFEFEYPRRLLKINRYAYFNMKCDDTRYALELEAYDKENELRELKGEEKLPPIKMTKLL